VNKVQSKLLEEIIEHEEKLNDWEANFVDYLGNLDRDTLTTNENHKLNQIYQKAVFQ